MELGAGVVQGRDAQEHVIVLDVVVLLLHLRRLGEAAVFVEDGLGEAGGAGGKIDGPVVIVGDEDLGGRGGAVRHQLPVALGKGGAVVPHVNQQAAVAELVRNGLDAADKLRAEQQHLHLRQVRAVLDLLRRVAEVEGHSNGPGFQNTEIDGQPFQAVIH